MAAPSGLTSRLIQVPSLVVKRVSRYGWPVSVMFQAPSLAAATVATSAKPSATDCHGNTVFMMEIYAIARRRILRARRRSRQSGRRAALDVDLRN